MADKEERILIDIIEPGLNCVYRMDNDPKGLSLCKHNGEEEPVSEKDCKSCLEGMTRQEAIEVMAKAICREDNCLDSCAECILGFGNTAEEKEQFCQKQINMSRDLSASYVSRAEAALNALLEGGKLAL